MSGVLGVGPPAMEAAEMARSLVTPNVSYQGCRRMPLVRFGLEVPGWAFIFPSWYDAGCLGMLPAFSQGQAFLLWTEVLQ